MPEIQQSGPVCSKERYLVDRFGEADHMRGTVHWLGSVIPGRHRLVASPESITTGLGVWIPGSLKSAPRNDTAYDSNLKIAKLERVPMRSNHLSTVMPGLVPGIYVFLAELAQVRRGWPGQARP